MFESLETRKLMSVSAHFAAGQLTVTGTAGNDSIQVMVAPQNHVTVVSGNALIYSSATHNDLVTGIKVSGGKGDDTISVSNNEASYAIR
jgi:hypothetical protein